MVAPGRSALAGLVEVDETEIACRSKHDPVTGGGGRSHQGKMLIVGGVVVGRGWGSANAGHVEDEGFCASQRTYERRRQLEVGAEAVEQQDRGTTLGTAFGRRAKAGR